MCKSEFKNLAFSFLAEDGQRIYLHGLNARVLCHEYGCLEYGPDIIGGRLLESEQHVMTPELRNRFRYLAHLPLTTNFCLAEIRFDRGIVSRATLEHFGGDSLL